jgi:soluble lytic murein transglycosylase
MPATAAVVAQSLGETPPKPEELFDPAVSLRLGAAEIGRLLREFSGRQAPAIAAYNAGEDQARLWLDQCGGSCTDALYLVNISFSATRDYTGEVMASALSYASLYDVAR